MPNPPKYNLDNLDDKTQFLCVRGNTLSIPRKDADNNPTRSNISSYYSVSNTGVPVEILNTGNVEVLENYLASHSDTLGMNEISHLLQRIDVMKYFNELGDYYKENKRTGVSGMQLNAFGQKVLPGISLDRKQDTSLGCWSCALSMLLKGRGVDVDQKLIRRYRPEFVQGNEIISPKQTDIVNSNMMSEVYQYSSLVDKICPNTKMCKMDKSGYGATEASIKTEVFKALREKNAPVAFCNGYHWTTIVGVNDAGTKFYVVDSQVPIAGYIKEVDVNTYLGDENAEFVWMEDIVLEHDGTSRQLPDSTFRVDPATGSVIPKIGGNIQKGANDMSITGNHILDSSTGIEYYVPDMVRDYSKSYTQQKEESDRFLESNGALKKTEAKPPKYTPISSYNLQAAQQKLEQMNENNVFSDRKAYLRDNHNYTQAQIDSMDRATADRLYNQFKPAQTSVQRPPVSNTVPPVKQEDNEFSVFNQFDNKNEFSLFNQQPETKQPASGKQGSFSEDDYMDDELLRAYMEMLEEDNISLQKQPSPDTKQKESPQKNTVQKDTGSNILAREIAEQRVAAYEEKCRAARSLKLSPARTELLEDIAASEYQLGSIAEAYAKAPAEQKDQYRKSFASYYNTYIARVVVSKKLEGADPVNDADIETTLTDSKSIKDFAKSMGSMPAAAHMIDRLLKNPDDVYFLNSEDTFKSLLEAQRTEERHLKHNDNEPSVEKPQKDVNEKVPEFHM